ncbi:MAG TPA: glycosyltransferase [Acidimicrobiales bacterium]|nr:glycosyltransferase [Acidimicrobiales bacterium]
MRVLLWHVHGSYATAFVQGPHTYLVPVLPDRGPDGRGRAQTWQWPDSVVEVTPEEAADAEVDVVVLQRPEELDHLAARWLGRRPGVDVPAVYLEHNAPEGAINAMRHPAADRGDLVVVHVTHFNDVFWDCGSTPTQVIEHGVIDPGARFTGERASAAVVVNDPLTRGRVVGADLLERFRASLPVDVYGMRTEPLGGRDLTQAQLHAELAHHRAYLHPFRWTSLGLSLIEAMMLGLPPVALATTEVVEAVPPGAGVVSNDLARLEGGLRQFLADPAAAAEVGAAARRAALGRYGLERFLADWDRLLKEVSS